ncbi:MAG: hypothetical protein FWD15_05420, partial [Alphaproteobacteria bacterium]|nr:hypothetical protein [Alphaproteobacteria bacterium]
MTEFIKQNGLKFYQKLAVAVSAVFTFFFGTNVKAQACLTGSASQNFQYPIAEMYVNEIYSRYLLAKDNPTKTEVEDIKERIDRAYEVAEIPVEYHRLYQYILGFFGLPTRSAPNTCTPSGTQRTAAENVALGEFRAGFSGNVNRFFSVLGVSPYSAPEYHFGRRWRNVSLECAPSTSTETVPTSRTRNSRDNSTTITCARGRFTSGGSTLPGCNDGHISVWLPDFFDLKVDNRSCVDTARQCAVPASALDNRCSATRPCCTSCRCAGATNAAGNMGTAWGGYSVSGFAQGSAPSGLVWSEANKCCSNFTPTCTNTSCAQDSTSTCAPGFVWGGDALGVSRTTSNYCCSAWTT